MANMTPARGNASQGRDLAERRAHPLDRLRREMDDLFDSFFGLPAPFMGGREWSRPWGVDVTTEGNEMLVRAEVPGFEPDDLDVRLEGDVLRIRAEHKQEGDGRRSYGHFEEAIRVPPGTDPNKAQATYHNGVLELRLPMPEENQGKRIPVQSGKAPAGQAQAAPAGQAKAAPAHQAGKK
jgi:HSP20 family protein